MQIYYEHIAGPPVFSAPRIGLSGNFEGDKVTLAKAYVEAVNQAGGTPFIIPLLQGREQLDSLLSTLDGIVFTGGADFDPIFLGEEPHKALGHYNSLRDEFELLLLKLAMDKQLPILGICRGLQLINLGMGGKLYQDIYSQHTQTCLQHSQTTARSETSHSVDVLSDTLLESLFNKRELAVNSFHHQAIKEPAVGLKVSAVSSDGIIEAVESEHNKAILGLQWHPECLVSNQRDAMLPVFDWLIKEALLYRKVRNFCRDKVTLDSHCDTALYFTEEQVIEPALYHPKFDFYAGIGASIFQDPAHYSMPENQVDLRKMHEGGLDCVVMAAYIKQGSRDQEGLKQAGTACLNILQSIQNQLGKYPSLVGQARSSSDILKLKSDGKKAILTAIENAHALGNNLDLLDEFDRRGVCYITLCHNGHNEVCDSASEENKPEHNGLSKFGKKLVLAMSDKGILVDVSHASEKTFYDVLDICSSPVIASHSSAKRLCNHSRNLSDEQILAISKQGGYIGLCLYDGFLAKNRPAGIKDAIAHINHIRSLGGIEIIGIGSDFDGGGGIAGCRNACEYFNLLRALMAEGYSDEDLSLLAGANFLRVLEQAQKQAKSTHTLL